MTPPDLPRNWSVAESAPTLREIGQRWLNAGKSAVLQVPSAVVVEEWNHILNPQHPDFKKLILQKPKTFQFDRRLARAPRGHGWLPPNFARNHLNLVNF